MNQGTNRRIAGADGASNEFSGGPTGLILRGKSGACAQGRAPAASRTQVFQSHANSTAHARCRPPTRTRSLPLAALRLILLPLLTGRAHAQSTYQIDRTSDTLIPRLLQTVPINWSGSALWNSPFWQQTKSYSLAALPASARSRSSDQFVIYRFQGLSGGTDFRAWSESTEFDFVITGPAGPTTVSGSMTFAVRVVVGDTGGYLGHPANNARVEADIYLPLPAGRLEAFGTYTLGNNGNIITANGLFAGHSGSALSFPVVLTGTFPVNHAFQVRLTTSSATQVYGDGNTSPGHVVADILIEYDNPASIMTLPAGYTVSAPGWGILNNALAPQTPTITLQPGDTSLCAQGPGGGVATLSFTASGGVCGPVTYKWQVESPAGSGIYTDVLAGASGTFTEPATGLSFDVSGANTGTLTVSNVHLGTHPNSIALVGVASSACGSVVSNRATLTICGADYDCDGTVDFFDYDGFVNAFETGEPRADFNHDNTIDFFDYDDFVVAFETGC